MKTRLALLWVVGFLSVRALGCAPGDVEVVFRNSCSSGRWAWTDYSGGGVDGGSIGPIWLPGGGTSEARFCMSGPEVCCMTMSMWCKTKTFTCCYVQWDMIYECGCDGTDYTLPPGIDDRTDGSTGWGYGVPPGNGPANGDEGCGMPVWRVSEPYVSLWLEDEPLGYQPALGPRISFDLAYKQRDSDWRTNANFFSVGKRWNFPWFSCVRNDWQTNKLVLLPEGGQRTYVGTNIDYVTGTHLTGDTTNGFTLEYPNGSQDVYGFVVTSAGGRFQNAFLTERRNPQGQRTLLHYYGYTPSSSPVIRLKEVVDGDGRTNRIYYVTSNGYSTNLISQVVDPFGRTNTLAYDNTGHLTNITDVAGLSSALTYDTKGWITNLTTPYGTTSFAFTDAASVETAPSGRSVLVTEPDGSHQLFLGKDSASGVASSYSSGEVPNTSPYSNTFDNSELHLRNTFHWGRRQYAALSTNNIPYFTSDDYRKARMRHWLRSYPYGSGQTLALERDPSPDSGGTIQGQKTWYDYADKTNNLYEGAQSLPLVTARSLPNGTTAFARTDRNSLGYVLTNVSTWAASTTVLLRTNTFTYAANGNDLIAATNALGVQVSSNAFNAYHQVVTNYSALNEITINAYNAYQQLIRVQWPSGLTTTNIYFASGDSSNSLAQAIDLEIGRTNSYTYINDLVLTHTDPRGLTTTNTWDALQRVRRMDFPDGTFITNTFDKLDLVCVVDRMGFSNSFGFNAVRLLTAATNALGRYTLYDYCSCGSLNSIRDPAGNYTWLNRDNLGRATNAVYADGYSVTNKFNLLGQLTNMTDSAGASVTNWFNNQGLPVAVSNVLGRVEAIIYDPLDRATNVVDANGVVSTNGFDALNRLLARGYPDGGVERFGFTLNLAGPTSYTNQLNQVTRYGYDAAQRRIAETNANNEVLRYTNNAAGDLLSLTDGKNQTTRWNRDLFGRATNKVDAAGNEMFRFAFHPNNRLLSRWTPEKGTTFYTNDAVGNLTYIKHPNSPDIALAYDALNQLTNMTDGAGTTRFSRNAVEQLLSEDGPWADDTVSYTYQNRQRASLGVAAPNASAWAQTYGYDAAKRLTNVTSPAGTFNYTYEVGQASSVSLLTLPNGAYITNSFDSMTHLLSTVLKNSGGSVLNSHAYDYNVGNQRTRQTFTAGNYLDYAYDPIGQLQTALGKEAGGATSRLHEQFGYGYDAAWNLNFRTNNALVQNFGVNNLNELSSVTRSGTLTVAGTTTSPATNVTVNALTATLYSDSTFAKTAFPLVDGTTNFTAIARDSYGRTDTNTVTVNLTTTNTLVYDLNGNLRTNGTQVLEYDDENQLTSVTVSNAWRSEFVYDGKFRRRIRKEFTWAGAAWSLTNEVRYVYDGNVVIQERDANNLPTLTLTRTGGRLLARTDHAALLAGLSAAHAYFHSDGNANITALINTNQVIVARYAYDPFGKTLAIYGPLTAANLYRFSSQEFHQNSGLILFLRRAYEPSLQRFINRDPIAELGGLNLYAYVGNNAVSLVDFLGLCDDGWWDLFFNGVGDDIFGILDRLFDSSFEGLAIGSDMIGQGLASVGGGLNDYQWESDLYRNINNNPATGPSFTAIALGTFEAEANIGTLGLYGMGKGFGTAAATGDFTAAQDASFNSLLLGLGAKATQANGLNPWTGGGSVTTGGTSVGDAGTTASSGSVTTTGSSGSGTIITTGGGGGGGFRTVPAFPNAGPAWSGTWTETYGSPPQTYGSGGTITSSGIY